MASYLLDSDCFLQAYKVHYPMDVATGFWTTLAAAAVAGHVRSIDRVKAELYTNPDALTNWFDEHLPDEFWLPSGSAVREYGQLMQWAFGLGQYSAAGLNEFARAENADAWLAALAMQEGQTLVTQEVSNPSSKRRVMLPDVCSAHGVTCCNTIEMYRRLGLTF